MAPKKHSHRSAAPPSTASGRVVPSATAKPVGRAIKRSITVRPDIDEALSEIAGGREYSQVANDAFTLYLQARGIDLIVRDVEAASGPLTRADHEEADRRLEDARRRAKQRRKLHG
jgi:hypothetical protein